MLLPVPAAGPAPFSAANLQQQQQQQQQQHCSECVNLACSRMPNFECCSQSLPRAQHHSQRHTCSSSSSRASASTLADPCLLSAVRTQPHLVRHGWLPARAHTYKGLDYPKLSTKPHHAGHVVAATALWHPRPATQAALGVPPIQPGLLPHSHWCNNHL
jgi:hypothetical protein